MTVLMTQKVSQGIQQQLKKPFFQQIIQTMNQKISKTSIAELILNYNDYHKWPKRIYNYYVRLKNEVTLEGSLKNQMQKFIANICQRLSLLGNYGNIFRNKIMKEMQSFCPSFNSNNWNTNYCPSDMDNQLKKIAEYYQSQHRNWGTNTKCKVQTRYQNNKMLAELQERIKTFYEFQRKKTINYHELQKSQNLINYILGPKNQSFQFMDRNCLRCTNHFIQNSTTNACHPAISFFPVDAYQLLNYQSFNNIQNNVRASMCSMLNEHSGGIILLGCEKQGTTILAKGLYITQKQKDSLQQKIEGYFAKIFPKVKRSTEVFIDFVPIIYYEDQLYKMQPIEGYYVCRIFLLTKQSYRAYLLKANAQHSTLQARINNQSITIPDPQHYNFIIQKFQKTFESKESNGIINCHYSIKCCEALQGKQAFGQKKQEQIIEEQRNSRQTQIQPVYLKKQTEKEKQNIIKNEQQYKFWTLVVGDKQTMDKLRQCANGKQNKRIKIEKMFQQAKFKLLKTTWIMFHDEKFQGMKKIAQKHNITHKGKQLKMIASNLYLQVEGHIQLSQYETLIDTIKTNLNSGVKQLVEKMLEGRKCWILQFLSLKGSIYAYFYLSDLGYKVKFIRGASHFKDSQNIISPVNISPGESTPTDQTEYNNQIQQPYNQNMNTYYNNQYDNNMQGYYHPQYGYYQLPVQYQYDPQAMYQYGYKQGYQYNNYYPDQTWQSYHYSQYNNGSNGGSNNGNGNGNGHDNGNK